MRRVFLVLLLGCNSMHGTSSADVTVQRVQLDSAVSRRISSAIDSTLRARQIPGAAVAVLHHDTLVFSGGFGLANVAERVPVNTETVFQIASLTKVFTAMSIMMMVEEGKVSLDAPASRYLNWLPAKYSTITIRQLLTHTSGVNPDLRRENVDEFDLDEFKRRLNEKPISFHPGTSVQYANTGFTLLSLIVEEASREEFGTFLRRRIFAPLGMVHSGYRVAEKNEPQHAKGYDLVNGQLQEAPHIFSGWGNSGIETTVDDMTKFARALDKRGLLSRASYDSMYAPSRLANDSVPRFTSNGMPTRFGFAWFIQNVNGRSILSHGGAIAGFASQLNRFVASGWTVIVLSNGKQGADRRGQADAVAAVVADAMGITTR
jgi:D-alanyl-D-alanine carboxypeptidase